MQQIELLIMFSVLSCSAGYCPTDSQPAHSRPQNPPDNVRQEQRGHAQHHKQEPRKTGESGDKQQQAIMHQKMARHRW